MLKIGDELIAPDIRWGVISTINDNFGWILPSRYN